MNGIIVQGAETTYLYKKCISDCLAQKSQTATPADLRIREFTDNLNFYCCN